MTLVSEEIIKLNCAYLDELAEKKISIVERMRNPEPFAPSDAFGEILNTMLIEVLGQYYSWIVSARGGRFDTVDDEFVESIMAKAEFIMQRRPDDDGSIH